MAQILQFSAPGKVEICQIPDPTPAAGQVVVQTMVSAISAGTEMLLYRGQMPNEMAADSTIAALGGQVRYPMAYGYAAVGRVVALGEGVEKRWRDQLVFAFQPHADLFAADIVDLHPLPPTVSAEQAVFLPNMETAVSLVMDGAPLIGERVVVLGQGVVGLLTTALLNSFPLAALVAVDNYGLRREAARKLGAQAALDSDSAEANIGLANADLVFELSGNPHALNQAIALCGDSGRVVIGSWYGQKTAPIQLGGRFHRSQMRLISSQVSRIPPHLSGRWGKARRFLTVLDMLARHQPQTLISHRIPFSQAADAYQLLNFHPEQTLQILLEYGA